MKYLHIYDHVYYKNGDKVYSSGAFTKTSWNRYLDHADHLTVAAHLSSEDGINFNSLNEVNAKNVSFTFIQDVKKPKRYLKNHIYPNRVLVSLIKDHDGVIIRLPSEVGYFAARIARKLKKPYAIEAVGCPWDAYWNHGRPEGKVFAWLGYYKMKQALKNADFAIYVTKHFLQQRYPTQGYEGNASNVMLPGATSTQVLTNHQNLILANGVPLKIGLIGSSSVKYKGHREAICALAEIKHQIPDFLIYFIGPGRNEWISALAKTLQLEEKVILVGKLKAGDEIFQFLDSLDLYLHPSKQEGLPRAVIEAMSRGCPVLASSIAGIPELLSSEHLHQPGDFKTLGKQMKDVLNSVDRRLKMSVVNFENAKNYYPEVLRQSRFKFWETFSTHVRNTKT